MPDAYWLDDYTTLELATAGGGSTDYVAGIQGITVTPNVSMEHLYTADSIKKETSKQQEFMADVEINFSIWDPEFVREWLGGDGSAASSMTDTSDPQEFEFTASLDSVSGDETVDMTVTQITFESIPVFDADRGEFAEWGLTGEAGDITDFTITDNTA